MCVCVYTVGLLGLGERVALPPCPTVKPVPVYCQYQSSLLIRTCNHFYGVPCLLMRSYLCHLVQLESKLIAAPAFEGGTVLLFQCLHMEVLKVECDSVY